MKTQRGFVYILALVVVLVTTAVSLTLARSVALRTQAQQAATARTQCRAAATGVLRAIMTDLNATMAAGSVPSLTTVTPAGESVGDCTVILVGRDPSGTSLRCGLIPTSGKLTVGHATVDQLAALPGMTTAIAAALVDWCDLDDEVDPNGGAERTDGAYAGASIPFAPRNAAPELSDEFRLVRDVTDSLYFGEDRNGNGMLDIGEDDNGDGQLTLGLRDLLTVDAREPGSGVDVTKGGTAKALGDLMTQSISGQRGIDLKTQAEKLWPFPSRLKMLLDLGLTEEEATTLWAKLSEGNNRVGLVDAWSCPTSVLFALTNDEGLDATIVAARPTTAPTSPLWLAQALGAQVDTYGRLFTFGSFLFDFDLLAVRNDGAGWARLQGTIDCSLPSGTPVLNQLRPAETQGWPFPWATLAMLRRGDAGSDVATFLTTPATR